MPSTEVDTSSTTPVQPEKEVEKFQETEESNCGGKHCKYTKTETIKKTTGESEKTEKEKFLETESKDDVNTPPRTKEETDCNMEEKLAETKENRAENSKRKSKESSDETKEEKSPPKKRKSS